MITITPTVTKVIDEPRREVTMSFLFEDDVTMDTRTISSTGKTKTPEEGKLLLDRVIQRYIDQIAHEALVGPIVATLESDAKIYMESELNG